MIVFENPGEIDLRSITTFGVSVKEGDNPIGFFGTGMKYAIAVLLRTGHKVAVQSGLQEVQFSTQRDSVRGQEFEFITMAVDGSNAQQLGFTTQLGKQWELWMAYRELACNCKDEKGEGRFEQQAPKATEGVTRVIVEGQDFEGVFSDSHLYILADSPAMVVGTTEIRRRPGRALFYRGVRVMELPKAALFTYNLNAKMELTEDRTVRNSWDVPHRIAQAVMESKDEDFIMSVITSDDRVYEGGLDYHGWGIVPSAEFLRAVGQAINERMFKVNATAMKVWQEATRQTIGPREITLSKVQLQSLQRAIKFCEGMGFKVSDYPIKVTDSLGDGGLGLAHEGTIYVAERAFEMGGAKQVAATMIEEFLHLRKGWKDCTRELQNYLFEKVISLGEEISGEAL